MATLTEAAWAAEADRVATYLYRDEHHWDNEHSWPDLAEPEKEVYRHRARTIGYMYGYPYNQPIIEALGLLCVCNPNPETTDGPQRDCPLHGELPDAVIRIRAIVWAAERYVMAGLCGNPDTRAEHAALIEAARTDR